ncbi:A-kinase anchor protein 200 [Lucilia cuprina]|uniref:A-kinase anchor protein 200 n=1 Tax=Lucilia cuprina TaxID=7375 RepID=UPI001F06F3B5|nr:A-kinase anchor protein 200 [Lucilia cuprina]XP_023306821.2 A-kinase anchor protein 200 [Lucilia cuprina]XP_023306822.2 A-kinase anchor protein 200 [Lucilia cuprina]
MGKAQSKRSVDITTETKKGAEDEITEKMEKIEDLDKKDVVNGDATISEKSDPEKKDSDEVENDKDMTTEKDVDAQAGGDSAEQQNACENSKEEGGSAAAEEISPLADESIKKSKKEKVKKKWSFRSISFGKKDKQKPAKNEDAAEDGSAATNGADAEEKSTTEPEASQKEKSANENEEKTAENQENGNATPKELNGVEHNEEKSSEEKSNDTANTTNNTTTTESCEPVQNETADISSELSEKTENMATATTINNEIKVSENATDDDTSKNGIDEKMNATEQEPQKIDVANASVESPSEKTSTIASAVTNESSASTNGEVVEKIHQNGDHGESELEVVEKSKAQIEVISNTDNKVSAATLDYISSTSINPSNVQIQVQDLNASSEMPDEKIQIDNDESCIQKSTEIKIQKHIAAQSSLSEANSSMTEDKVENNSQNETVANLISETGDTEKSVEDKVGDEPSPPPLPISPPPSQVSVFAFTSNAESVEDSIETKNSESSNNQDEENKEEISQPIPPPSELKNTEDPNNIETNAIHNEKHEGEIYPDNETPQTHVDNDNEKVEIECDETNEEQEASVCKEMPLHEDEAVPSSTGSSEELQNEEEALVAAAVINEITEKAAEIVGEQLKYNVEHTTDEQSLQSNEERQEELECNNEIVKDNTVEEFDNEVKTNKDQHDFDNKIECEITISSEETPLEHIEQSNNITTECSSDFSASNSIQQNEDVMVSINKSDNSDEELLNPTKEFANAKDIKDNITVAEITQDLSVTCE